MISKLSSSLFEKSHSYNSFLIFATLTSFLVGLYYSLIASPPDIIQGNSMRIMYIHVPAAWLSLMIYSLLAFSCVLWFILRNPLLSLIGQSLAPIGATFTLIALITGSIWGKPTWGTWWAWDARLTSMLILFFLYLAYILLWKSVSNKDTASKIAAALGIIGFINIPIIKFSVDWWNTLHQPATISKLSAPSIDIAMLVPLMIMMLASMFFLLTLFLIRMRIYIIEQKITRLVKTK